jgi:hypothetical protein
MPTKEEYDAMTDNELRKYASTLPLTYNKNWSRAEKDLYNAIQRRDYKLRKQGKTFEYVPKLEIQAKGSSTASELPTERQMSEEKAKQIIADAVKARKARQKLRYEADDYFFEKGLFNIPEKYQKKLTDYQKKLYKESWEKYKKEMEKERQERKERQEKEFYLAIRGRSPPTNQRFRPDY